MHLRAAAWALAAALVGGQDQCSLDIDSNGVVGIDDLLRMLAAFGTCCAEPCADGSTPAAAAGSGPSAAVSSFYAAVDTKDFAALRTAVAPGYSATFSPGCATVGGAKHCGEETLGIEQLVTFIDAFDARAGGTIERELVATGNTVVNHYTADGGHGAAVHNVVDGLLISSFWYGGASDTRPSDAVSTFYAAVDTKNFAALEKIVTTATYTASFGPGCAIIGGAHHCGDASLNYDEFVAMLEAEGPRAGGTIDRDFTTAGDGSIVMNHYSLADGSHGTAVHYVTDGLVSSSFWYGGSLLTSDVATHCGSNGECTVQIVQNFYAAIDQNPATAGGVDDLDGLVSGSYTAVFGSGCSQVGGASQCGENAMDVGGLKDLVRGKPRGSTIARELVSSGPNGATVVNRECRDPFASSSGLEEAAAHRLFDGRWDDGDGGAHGDGRGCADLLLVRRHERRGRRRAVRLSFSRWLVWRHAPLCLDNAPVYPSSLVHYRTIAAMRPLHSSQID